MRSAKVNIQKSTIENFLVTNYVGGTAVCIAWLLHTSLVSKGNIANLDLDISQIELPDEFSSSDEEEPETTTGEID